MMGKNEYTSMDTVWKTKPEGGVCAVVAESVSFGFYGAVGGVGALFAEFCVCVAVFCGGVFERFRVSGGFFYSVAGGV